MQRQARGSLSIQLFEEGQPLDMGMSGSDLAKDMPVQKRGGLGVKLMDLAGDKTISSVAIAGEEGPIKEEESVNGTEDAPVSGTDAPANVTKEPVNGTEEGPETPAE